VTAIPEHERPAKVRPEQVADTVHRIVEWWRLISDQDAQAAATKTAEYGGGGAAVDLVWLGEQLIDMNVAQWPNQASPIELGIFFYLLGKMARWKAAILEGRPVSDDTLKDITTYAMMVRFQREHGSWP